MRALLPSWQQCNINIDSVIFWKSNFSTNINNPKYFFFFLPVILAQNLSSKRIIPNWPKILAHIAINYNTNCNRKIFNETEKQKYQSLMI